MKFSSVLLSEDSSARPYQMCGQILTFPEKKDLMHNMVTTSNKISCMSTHQTTTTSQPNQTEKKKKVFTMAPLNHMHEGHCSYFTILKMAAVSSTIILPPPPNQPFDQITSTNTTKLAASSNTTDGSAKTLLKPVELITRNHGHFAQMPQWILDPSRIWTPFADLDSPTKFSF